MTAAILQIIAGLGGIISLWLRDYYSAEAKAKRAQEAGYAAIQQGRNDLVNGNTDAVSTRIDRLLRAEADHSAERRPDGKTQAR